MTEFTIKKNNINIHVKNNTLSTYQFGTHQAEHYFCKNCGIYTFHQTMLQLEQLRFNIDCLTTVDSAKLPFKTYEDASI